MNRTRLIATFALTTLLSGGLARAQAPAGYERAGECRRDEDLVVLASRANGDGGPEFIQVTPKSSTSTRGHVS